MDLYIRREIYKPDRGIYISDGVHTYWTDDIHIGQEIYISDGGYTCTYRTGDIGYEMGYIDIRWKIYILDGRYRYDGRYKYQTNDIPYRTGDRGYQTGAIDIRWRIYILDGR